MNNKIFSQEQINVYSFSYKNDESLTSMLSDFEEIAWIERVNGFKEGVIKTTNLKGLNLENRHMQISFIPEIRSYLEEKSLSFVYPNENVFVKVLPETFYAQNLLNPALVDTVSILYVANNNHSESVINFLNKNISIPLLKGNLIIFPSLEEYSYKIEGVNSGEVIVGISYLEVENA